MRGQIPYAKFLKDTEKKAELDSVVTIIINGHLNHWEKENIMAKSG